MVRVRPGGLRKKRLVLAYFDGPVSDWDTNEVEACGGDIGEILLSLRSFIVSG